MPYTQPGGRRALEAAIASAARAVHRAQEIAENMLDQEVEQDLWSIYLTLADMLDVSVRHSL
jgi:hypothetical protein